MDSESSTNARFDELWNQALDRYFDSTDRSPEDKTTLTAIHNAEDLSTQLKTGHGTFGDWRKKHSKFFSALSKGVKPFVLVSEIAQSAVGLTPFAPASTVLGAVFFLVKAADGVSEAYDWIEQLFNKLSGFTQRLEQYVGSSMNTHLQHKVVAILSCLLEILGRSEKVIKDGRFRRYAVVLFLGKDEKVKDSFDRLSNLFDDEQRLAIAINYATSQRIEMTTDKIETSTERVKEVSEQIDKKLDVVGLSLQEANMERRSSEQKALLEKYLDNPARRKSLALYSQYAEDALKSSGEWLLSEAKFQDWTNQKSSLLWVAGGPGTGKSYLSAIAISKLNDTYPRDPAHPSRLSIGYFYIKEHDQDLQDLSNLLKTIAYQISNVDAVFQGRVLRMLSKPETTATPRKIWENLFLGFYCSPRSISNTAMIVIDGLDEAPKKTIKELFYLLEDLKTSSQDPPRLSFALFGRPELTEYIEPKLEKILSVIEIGEKNLVDIGLFIKEHVKDVLVIRQLLRSKTKVAAARLARQIRDKVMAKADGMFFKVVLIMEQLYDKERTESVFQAINDAPPQLEGMINHVFERLLLNEDVNKTDLHEILTWVAFSKRPLHIAELYAILRMRTGQAYDALEARLRGRFASLFKLNCDQGDAINDKLGGDDTNGDDDFDIDLDSDEIDPDDASDAGPTMAQGQSDAKKSVQEESLNVETVKRFRSIDVRFTHASIRDFLVKDRSKSLAPMLDSSIGIDSSTADMHLASMCMQAILEFNFVWEDCEILGYASVFFMDHLLAIETSKIGIEEKQHIIHQLCGLFHDPVGVRKLIEISQMDFNKALHHWFENPEFSARIRKDWLNNATGQDQYSMEEWEWISKATDSREEFFRPLATEASRFWLSRKGYDDQTYLTDLLYRVWIVHCYLDMDASDSQKVKSLDVGGLTAQLSPDIDLEALNKLARFSSPEENQHWHTCFGWVLVKAEQYAEALLHFNEALEIDKTLWKALQGRSKCLAQQEKYDEAAQDLEDALKLVPESMKDAKYTVAVLQGNLTNVILAKGDYIAALHHAQEIYSSNPTHTGAITDYVKALYALHDHEGIVKTIEDLREIEATSTKWEPLNFLGLRSVQFEIGCALRIKAKLDLVTRWVNACSPLDESLRAKPYSREAPWSAAHMAEFTYSFYSQPDESMAICEHILSSEFKSALGPELAWAYEYPSMVASQILSNVYFEKAISAQEAGKDPECWTSKLRDLATTKEGSRNSSIASVYKLADASLLLGIFLRHHEGADESTWKPCFRGRILEGIDMLSDDDDINDASGYVVLAEALMAAGNKTASHEAFAVLLKPLEVISNSGLVKSLEAIGFSAYFYGCDGPCVTPFHTYKDPPYKELYRCEDCLYTQFCEDCLPIAKRGELPYRECSPDHSIVQVFPIREEARDVAARLVDGKMVVQKDWLDALRKEWL